MSLQENIESKFLLKSLLTVLLAFLTVLIVIFFFFNPSSFVGSLNDKTVIDTWKEQGPSLRKFQTDIAAPDFVGALLTVDREVIESYRIMKQGKAGFMSASLGGDPSPNWNRFFYSLLQSPWKMKTGNSLCISQNRVYKMKGGLKDPCWRRHQTRFFNSSRNIEILSAQLTIAVKSLMRQQKIETLDISRQQTVAAVAHRCGLTVARDYMAHEFRAPVGIKCEGVNLSSYIRHVKSYQLAFKRAQTNTKG